MKMNYFEIKKMPILVIDDFFTEEESNQILKECIDINKSLSSDPERNGSAWHIDENGNKIYKKSAKGGFLDTIFEFRREESAILTINRKVFNRDFMSEISKYHYFFSYIEHSNKDNTLIHYYEDDNGYDFHEDNAVITLLSWHFSEPKKFSGGNLILDEDERVSIESLNRRILIMPSIIGHKVETVSMNEEDKNKDLGRFSVAQFIYLV